MVNKVTPNTYCCRKYTPINEIMEKQQEKHTNGLVLWHLWARGSTTLGEKIQSWNRMGVYRGACLYHSLSLPLKPLPNQDLEEEEF